MIVVADVNTIWRAKPFAAVAEQIGVLGLRPRDPRVAWRERRARRGGIGGDGFGRAVLLPPSWASRTAGPSQRWLWRRARALAGGQAPQALVVTSPHYLPLARRLAGALPVYYYASDDYRSYDRWGTTRMAQDEAALAEIAAHSFFVSEALAARARREYGLGPDRVSVSMNATEDRFLGTVGAPPRQPPGEIRHLQRPVVGVVGGVNGRLDWELLAAVAELAQLGTLLFVGPEDPALAQDPHFRRVRQHPRCVFAGARPHAELPVWMQALDVALIPYADSAINRYCSPMRLFDHLASGRPVVATAACEQVNEFSPWIAVERDPDAFLARVARLCEQRMLSSGAQIRAAQAHLWRDRAQALLARMQPAQVANGASAAASTLPERGF